MADIYILDGGHALKGAVGSRGNNLCEEIEARKVVKRLSEMLKEHKYKCYIASIDEEKDKKKQLYRIVEKANNFASNIKGVDAKFISIHLNHVANPEAEGLETYYYPTSVAGKQMASKVQTEILKEINWKNRGIKKAEFYVLEKTKMPSCLVELGFISNKKDMEKFNVEKISRSIFKALTGKDYKKVYAKLYKVQTGAYVTKNYAIDMQGKLKKKGFDSFITEGVKDNKKIYRVQLGAFKDRANAEVLKCELRKKGFDSFIVEV